MKLETTESLNEKAEYLRLLVYGLPGSGKTWFGASAGTSPLTTPALFVNYKSQIASVREYPNLLPGGLKIITLDKYDDINIVYNWLKGVPSKSFDKLFDGQKPKTLIIDSITELQRTEILIGAGAELGKEVLKVGALSPVHPKKWLAILDLFSLLARQTIHSLPMHVVFSCLQKDIFKPHTKNIMEQVLDDSRPFLQGQGKDIVPAYALTVMQLQAAKPGQIAMAGDKKVEVFNWGNLSRTSVASMNKDQTGRFPKRIANPTIPKMVKMLKGVK